MCVCVQGLPVLGSFWLIHLLFRMLRLLFLMWSLSRQRTVCIHWSSWGSTWTTYMTDNITYYKCDVSKWSEVEAVAGRIKGEVCPIYWYGDSWWRSAEHLRSGSLLCSSIMQGSSKENWSLIFLRRTLNSKSSIFSLLWASWMLIVAPFEDFWSEHTGALLDHQSVPPQYAQKEIRSYCELENVS